MPFEQAERYLTGRPVTVRPMTRRWISEVPSKIVKIFGPLRTALLSPVYAGKWAYSSAHLGLERPGKPSDGPGLLPRVLPAGGLVPVTDWPFISYDPTTYPPLPQAETDRPTLRERLTRFVSLLVIRTGAYVTAFLGFYVLATGQI